MRINVSCTLCMFQHALVLDVCWTSFLLHFPANSATSWSQYSTWCFVNFLLENNRFSHLLQFPVHGTAHDVCWISYLSINRFSYTLQLRVHVTPHDVCWISLSSLHVSRIHCSFMFMVQPMVFVEISSTCMLFGPLHCLPSYRWIWKSDMKIWEYSLLSHRIDCTAQFRSASPRF